ncbi:hypothetical protein CCHR01_16089 [Colletotrichum chrysophilum]|uniref:Uncharacterized protein n=1 Tax=Colletotrichum chrysophilum TaxID=1836956 RepID=A0AAD9EB61_9PEZI|nr:hypothetical protein CCHR01_16089 [Colletotrichum chrysophilum]
MAIGLCSLVGGDLIEDHLQAALRNMDSALILALLFFPGILVLGPEVVNLLLGFLLTSNLLLSGLEPLLRFCDGVDGLIPFTSKFAQCGRGSSFEQSKLALQGPAFLGGGGYRFLKSMQRHL